MTRILTATLALGLAAAATTAAAMPVVFDGGWMEQKFKLFSKNRYGLRGGKLDVASAGTVSMLWRPVAAKDWGATEAAWSWSVGRSVPATDLTQKGGDDRNLALYFVFLPRAEAERIGEGGSIRALLDSDAARVLVYVWGGAHKRGDVLPSPYLGARGKTVILRPSGTGSHAEAVNLARDYGRAFGGSPEALVGLAVSADSDDTDSAVEGAISGLVVQ